MNKIVDNLTEAFISEIEQLKAEIQRLRTVLEDIANNPPGSSWRLIKIAKEALSDCKEE